MNPKSTVLVLRAGKAHKNASRSVGGLEYLKSGLDNTPPPGVPKISMVNVFCMNPANTELVGREKYWGNF
jgi:hypothetical protein